MGTTKRLHLSYVGVELRGNDQNIARIVKENFFEIFFAWSHGAMGLGFKAAPFIAAKQMLGPNMLTIIPFVKVIDNPLTDTREPGCLIPAHFPDLCIIHGAKRRHLPFTA